ncbi:FAD-dependent monooxygenase [Aureimonas psammosilenae]|uniref:FAD-dependent monooxygenase n=1 Tax=Aureimonas psammosilenae TaxID=2495496 RepID=UPI001260A891|nr:FAD-dependent monooxygenase [Aureimonas psammosilenae]
MTITASFDTDVVIVGAGPVGLATACALARHGVAFRIFERAPGISGASKGHNVIARAQELLASIGVRDTLAKTSYVAPYTQYMLDGRPIHRQSTRDLPSPYPDVLFSNQGTIEAELSDHLKAGGHHIEHSHEVRGIDQDADGVAVTVVPVDEDGDASGEAMTLRCRYLVGADGVKGAVRKAVGLDFEAQDLPGWAIRQIDGTLTWRRPIERDTAFFFLFPHGFAGVLPVWKDQYRLFLLESEEAMPARDPTREEMVARGREVTGDATFDIADPTWVSHGTFRHGVAPSYGAGRVFLVGDAAHANLPIGGQGMNSGFIDAVSLGWRLAMVLAGAATPTLLDNYAEERHAANRRLDAQQVRGFRQLMGRGRAADAVLGAIAGAVPQVADYVFGGSDLAQLDLTYRDSRLSEDRFARLDPRHVGSTRAGDRVPDAPLVLNGGEATTLFDQIRNPDGRSWGWRLLLLDGGDRETHPHLAAAADAFSSYDWVRPLLVVADLISTGDEPQMRAAWDLDQVVHQALGLIGAPAILLVRPDGHLSFRGDFNDLSALVDHVATFAVPMARS